MAFDFMGSVCMKQGTNDLKKRGSNKKEEIVKTWGERFRDLGIWPYYNKTQEKNENWIGAMNMILFIITMIGGIIIYRQLF